MKSVKSYLVLLLLLVGGILHAQDRSVSGKVLSGDDGLPLPGVNISVKGTMTGTSTDFDGAYTITVPDNSAILQFSYVGFVAQEIPVGTRNEIDVTLQADANQLDEVVVVGYGSVKKSDITGSVSSVKSEELNAFPVLNAEQALQGRAAGVAVQTKNGGEPGAPLDVTIRGNTSISASSSALIVVDGFVGATMPQAGDIESIEILKDASATAIYGSRGANGVIMVTTKKGRAGKMNVEFRSTYSSQNVSDELKMLNADEFATYYKQINPAYVQGPANTDWQDEIYRNGNTQDYQLAFSGGTENINYYISGNYFDQKGVVVNSGFNRISILSNVDAKISDKFKVGLNVFGSHQEKDGVQTQAGTGGFGTGDVVSLAYRFNPDLPIYDENGNVTTKTIGDEVDNPYAVATMRTDETKTDRYRANFYAAYEIIKDLTFKTTFGFSTTNGTRGRFAPSTLPTSAGVQGGIANIDNVRGTDVLSENYLTYVREIGKGNLTALVGYSYQKITTERNAAGAQGFISNSVSYRNLAGGSTILTPSSSLSETEIVSLFGRLNYDYDDRFLFTFTARQDGSSNFAKNEKYAFFPSGAFAWRISNEDFLKDNNTLSNLKLRLSYGLTGNPSIAPYQSLASYSDIYSVIGDNQANAVVPEQLANPDLRWETSYQGNIGLDFGFWLDRLTLSVDYYNIDTKDVILGDTSAPEYVGFLNSTSLKNIGEINNSGFEIALNARIISTEDFSWTADFNWARNRNEIKQLVNGDDIFLDASPGHFLQDETHVLREGEAVGQFWGYQYRGVNQGGDLPAGTASFSDDSAAGGELFSDLNGDGKIDTNDRTIIGDPNQDWTAGFNNTLRYKDFDLNIFFQGAYGGEIFNFNLLEAASGGDNATKEAIDVWTPNNTDTDVPSAKVRAKRITDRFIYDGSYIRLKNLALGYNVPYTFTEKAGIENLRVSISGQNLLTFTDYPTDPEVSYRADTNQTSNTNLGFDYGNYPNFKSVTFSLSVKF